MKHTLQLLPTSLRRSSASLVLWVLLLGWLPLAGAVPARAQTQPVQVTLSPDPVVITGCNSGYVDVWVNAVSDLYGADIRLSFDPAVIEIVDADVNTPGVQMQPLSGFLSAGFVVRNEADNSLGTLWYAATQLNPTPPAAGSGAIIRIHLRAKSAVSGVLHFTTTKLSTRDGVAIPSVGVDGTVQTGSLAAPVLSIARLAPTTARLTWTATPGASYRLYRATQPFFTPGAPFTTTSAFSYDDVGALGNPAANYFYALDAVCPHGAATQVSNRVGEFDFTLLRNANNAVGIPLQDASLGNADALGSLTGATRVSSWNAATGSFVTRLVGISGPNFPISTGAGYMVYTPNAGPTVFTLAGGVPAPGSIQFPIHRQENCSVNLLTLPLDQASLATADALAGAIQGVPRISYWNAGMNLFVTRITGSVGTNFSTLAGYPYWPCANQTSPVGIWP